MSNGFLIALAIVLIGSIVLDWVFKDRFSSIHFLHRLVLITNAATLAILAMILLFSGSFTIQTIEEYFRLFLALLTVQYLLITPGLFFYYLTKSFILTGVFSILFILGFSRGANIFSLESMIIRIGVVGVAIMAVLSGFAAVSTPLNSLSAFKINIDQKILENLKRQLSVSIDKVFSKKKYLARQTQDSRSILGVDLGVGLFSTSNSSISAEIGYLQNFVDELLMDINELHLESQNHDFSKTIPGRIRNTFGYIFSGVCIFKVFNSLSQLVFKRFGAGEGVVTRILNVLAGKLGLDLDVDYWSHILSLILIAVLMISSIRSFLMQSLKVFRYIRPLLEKNLVILLFSQLIGFYSLSMILMLRPNLPLESTSRILLRKIVKMDDFEYHQQWYDFIFVISCIISAVIMAIEYKLRSQKYKDQKQWID